MDTRAVLLAFQRGDVSLEDIEQWIKNDAALVASRSALDTIQRLQREQELEIMRSRGEI